MVKDADKHWKDVHYLTCICCIPLCIKFMNCEETFSLFYFLWSWICDQTYTCVRPGYKSSVSLCLGQLTWYTFLLAVFSGVEIKSLEPFTMNYFMPSNDYKTECKESKFLQKPELVTRFHQAAQQHSQQCLWCGNYICAECDLRAWAIHTLHEEALVCAYTYQSNTCLYELIS